MPCNLRHNLLYDLLYDLFYDLLYYLFYKLFYNLLYNLPQQFILQFRNFLIYDKENNLPPILAAKPPPCKTAPRPFWSCILVSC